MKNVKELKVGDPLSFKEKQFLEVIKDHVPEESLPKGKTVRINTRLGDYFVWVEINSSSFLNCGVMEYGGVSGKSLMYSNFALAYDQHLVEYIMDVKREVILV